MVLHKTFAILIVITALFATQFQSVASESTKLKELQNRMQSSMIIEFTKDDFKNYWLEEHSDYDVLLYYTLSSKWEHCVTIEEELKQVAYSFIQSERHLHNDETKRPVIFAKIEYNALNSDIFALSNYTSVPILALVQPSLVKSFRDNRAIIYPSKLEWKISSMDFYDAGKIMEHVNKITNSNVELKYTLSRVMIGNVLILCIAVGLFLLKDIIAMVIQNKTVWMIGTFIIFVMWVGGTAFNMIHSPPTFKYKYDQSGSLSVEEYFRRDQRSQYYGEGYLTSMLMLTIGVIFILFTLLNQFGIKDSMRKEAIGIIFVLVLFGLIMMLAYVFGIKSHHYTPSLFPPDHYMSGPYSNDQGTNI